MSWDKEVDGIRARIEAAAREGRLQVHVSGAEFGGARGGRPGPIIDVTPDPPDGRPNPGDPQS